MCFAFVCGFSGAFGYGLGVVVDFGFGFGLGLMVIDVAIVQLLLVLHCRLGGVIVARFSDFWVLAFAL